MAACGEDLSGTDARTERAKEREREREREREKRREREKVEDLGVTRPLLSVAGKR
jgi:hypothetical protein